MPHYVESEEISMKETEMESPPITSSHHEPLGKIPRVYCIRNKVVVIMERDSIFSFTGKLSVKVLYGGVVINGFVFDTFNNETEVYCPRGYSRFVVKTSAKFRESTVSNIWTLLSEEGIMQDKKNKLQVDINNIQPGMAVLVLKNLDNKLTLFLETFCSYKLFPKIKHLPACSWTDSRRAESILKCSLYLDQNNLPTYRRFIIPCQIDNIVVEGMVRDFQAQKWTCMLVAGGKSVGKSSTVRYVINTLLQNSLEKVVLMDLDPGQAECTPAGCISYSLIEKPLIGPNFTHLKKPIYQLHIDDINISRCVPLYLEAVKMLSEKLRNCPILSRLPIVINTMGFTGSIGWDLIIYIIKLIKPSYILQLQSKKKKNNFPGHLDEHRVNMQSKQLWSVDQNFIDWNTPCQHVFMQWSYDLPHKMPNEMDMEPYQKRELAMISYLSDIIPDNAISFQDNINISPNIEGVSPYTVPFSSLCIIPQRLCGVPESRALSAINGNIVALCGIDLSTESSQKPNTITTIRVLTQRSPLCTCYGFGIVRGIDMERKEVFINTPLPMYVMQRVNCLAGCTPVPPSLLQLIPHAPYVSGNIPLPTSRMPRRGYFRMRFEKGK